jgi:hypothetical protein
MTSSHLAFRLLKFANDYLSVAVQQTFSPGQEARRRLAQYFSKSTGKKERERGETGVRHGQRERKEKIKRD